jgi:hypothetical protein
MGMADYRFWRNVINKEENSPTTIQSIEESKPVKKTLPDLFSLIDDENFGKEENELKSQKNNSSESNISAPSIERKI